MNLTQLLAPTQLQRIAPLLEDIRTYPQNFRGLARVPFVPAEDGDILARVTARVTAGDILPDGAPSFPKADQPVTLEQIAIANFVRSFSLGPDQLSLLARILRNGGIQGEVESFGQYIGRKVAANRAGNYARMEQAVWGMFLDSYSYTFAGTIFTVTWNKPSDLKVTPGTAWSVAAAATPVNDIQSLVTLAADKYGVNYNRVEMPTADFTAMLATDEFQNLAKAALALPSGATLPPGVNSAGMREFAARVLGVDQVVVMDQSIDTEGMDGSITTTKLLPAHKVLLSRTQDDNNEAVWQFNNGTVLQSIVAAITGEGSGGMVGGFDGVQRGPVTFAVANLEASQVKVIDVARAFPGTSNPAATAVLTVG